MSLTDAFAAALAKREKAEVYTGDPEFNTVEREIKVDRLQELLASLNKCAIRNHDPPDFAPAGQKLVRSFDRMHSSSERVRDKAISGVMRSPSLDTNLPLRDGEMTRSIEDCCAYVG
jgi:hypothetical protein